MIFQLHQAFQVDTLCFLGTSFESVCFACIWYLHETQTLLAFTKLRLYIKKITILINLLEPYASGVCSITGMSWRILHSWLIEYPLWDNSRDLHSRIPTRSGILLSYMNGQTFYRIETHWDTLRQHWDTFTCVEWLIRPEGHVSSFNKSNPIQLLEL